MIPLTLLDVDIIGDPQIDLGSNPGSALRGALYEAMRTIYDDESAANSRGGHENPVAWLMRLEDENTTGGKYVPRPLALRPPITYTPERATFGIALYGTGQEYLGLVTSAVAMMGRLGMGRGRHPFRVAELFQVDPLTHTRTAILDNKGKRLAALQPAPSWDAYQRIAQALCQERLSVNFLTPTRLIQDDHLSHQPILRVWVQRLLERIRTLSQLYCTEAVWIPFDSLLASAKAVNTVHDGTHWVEAWSASRQQGKMRPTSGFVGRVEYEGSVGDLLPYIILGQALQVGKNVIKGCGWYRIHYQWG